MFNLKPIVTTTIILGSIVIQQSAIAYPRASQESEISYLQSAMKAYSGQFNPEFDSYVEEQYKNKSDLLQNALTAAYQMCDDIKLANQKGISGKTLLEKEIDKLTGVTLEATGTIVTEEHIVIMYDNVTNHLCPGLY